MSNLSNFEFDYISDVHTDFWVKPVNPLEPGFINKIEDFIKNILKPKTSNVLIMAGDQGHYFSQDSQLLISLLEYYKHIVLVPGNHDMYLLSNKARKKYKLDSQNRIEEMKLFCSQHKGLHYLDGDSVTIDGITIAGLGMWHDDSYGLKLGYHIEDIHQEWKNRMNDANHIYQNGKDNYKISMGYGAYRKVSSFDPVMYFQVQRKILDNIKTAHIMVTHYGPRVPDAIPDEYNNLVASFFFFDGLNDIERIKPKYWVHGHSHKVYDEMYDMTNIICNPLGYPDENTYVEIQTRSIKCT